MAIERDVGAAGGAWATAPVFRIKSSLADEDRADRARLRRVVARAKSGDRDALRQLYERYSDNVFSYVRTIIHDEHEAEDVTQHVFTKLLTKIDRYEERSVPFAAWLLRIARNCAIDHVRGNRAICYEEVPSIARTASRTSPPSAAMRSRMRCARFPRAAPGRRPAARGRPLATGDRVADGKERGRGAQLHHRARRAMRTELLRRGTAPVARQPKPVSVIA